MGTVTYKVCDRCGKKMTYSGWTAMVRTHRFKITELFNGNPSGYDYCDEYIELCSRCTAKLKDFLKGDEDE